MSKPILIVSCDEHTGPPTEAYRPYLEKRFHARLDDWEAQSKEFFEKLWEFAHVRPEQFDVADNDGALASGGLDGAWQLDRRLEEMNREGVVFGITNPNANDTKRFHMPPFPGQGVDFATNFGSWTADEMMAGAKAHNRWLADFRDASGGRVHGCALTGPFADMDETVAEMEWLANNGFRVITIPAPPLDERYERFWAACQDLGLVVNAHAGHSGSGAATKMSDLKPALPAEQVAATLAKARALAGRLGQDPSDMDKQALLGLLGAHRGDPSVEFSNPDGEVLAEAAGMTAFDLNVGDRGPLWQLMLSAVLDRYPGLKITFSEIRSDWVPATLTYLDKRIPELNPALKLKPSEYWKRNFHVAASFIRPVEVQLRHEIGIDQLMFSRDYPHPEGTWPNTLDWIRAAFAGVPELDARAILGENALDWFGFDRNEAENIARRIGPTPEGLLGDQTVSPVKLAYFQSSSNFNRPRIPVDPAAIEYELTERPYGVYTPYAEFREMVLKTDRPSEPVPTSP